MDDLALHRGWEGLGNGASRAHELGPRGVTVILDAEVVVALSAQGVALDAEVVLARYLPLLE